MPEYDLAGWCVDVMFETVKDDSGAFARIPGCGPLRFVGDATQVASDLHGWS
jgi:hypothetical protein